MNIIQDKKDYLLSTIENAKRGLAKLEIQEKQYTSAKGIEKYLGNSFESSSGLTEEYATFAREYRSAFKKAVKGAFEVISFNRGHFYLSGFVKNVATGKLAHFSTSDIRGSGDGFYNNILIRTAKHDKDFTGGSNNMTNFPNLKTNLLALTN